MQRTETARYNIVVKNRPGELAKLTKLLSDAGVNVSGLMIANLGDRSSIRFAAPLGRRKTFAHKSCGVSASRRSPALVRASWRSPA